MLVPRLSRHPGQRAPPYLGVTAFGAHGQQGPVDLDATNVDHSSQSDGKWSYKSSASVSRESLRTKRAYRSGPPPFEAA